MSRPTSQWMPMYWGVYIADTRRLSTLEHGAYLLLIADYWQSGQPLPDDDKILAKIAGLTVPKWKAIRQAIAAFFVVADGLWRHKRIDLELAAAQQRYERRAAAGQRGGVAKASSNPSIATAKPEQSTPQVQGTENQVSKTLQGDSQSLIRSLVPNLKKQKDFTPEQRKAAWLSNICKELERTLTADKFALWLEAYGTGDRTAIELAEQTDRRLKREKERRLSA